MTQRPREFLGLAHIHHLDLLEVLLHPLRLDLPEAPEGEDERRPSWLGELRLSALAPAATEIGGNGDIDLLRMRQPKILHIPGEVVFAEVAAEARIEAPLL